MRTITFDIETFGEFGSGARAYDNIELTICCIHDSETDSYDSFLKEDLPRLWKILEHTDLLVGYNSDHFDIPIRVAHAPARILNHLHYIFRVIKYSYPAERRDYATARITV